jgi:hypothetical protein
VWAAVTQGTDGENEDLAEEPDDLKDLVLDYLRGWPSDNPSPARIAQAIGRSPKAVIDKMTRLRSSGDIPAAPKLLPLPPRQRPEPEREQEVVKPPPSWDRSN